MIDLSNASIREILADESEIRSLSDVVTMVLAICRVAFLLVSFVVLLITSPAWAPIAMLLRRRS